MDAPGDLTPADRGQAEFVMSERMDRGGRPSGGGGRGGGGRGGGRQGGRGGRPNRKPKGVPLDGWLIVDKPSGIGSTDVVNKVKRAFDAQKAGHGGTLDPLATGLLPVAFGAATKTVPYVMDGTKTYHSRCASARRGTPTTPTAGRRDQRGAPTDSQI
jgi:hypothetical protein